MREKMNFTHEDLNLYELERTVTNAKTRTLRRGLKPTTHQRVSGWARRVGAGGLALALAGGLGWVQAPTASAATVYQIEGNWEVGTPATVTSGTPLVSPWRINVNDDSAAPTNDPVDNVAVTFVAQNGVFTALPSVCLATGVNPVSVISTDKKTLVCNLGTRDQGTAELLLTGLQASGPSGSQISITATIGGAQAVLPPINLTNQFMMDMKFSGGSPTSVSTNNDAGQVMSFPWSLRRGLGSPEGPNTVSYNLTFIRDNGEIILPNTSGGCTVQNLSNAGFPNSGAGFAPNRTAPFPTTCTLTSTGSNTMRLTLTGINYAGTPPTVDSAGSALPAEWDVVAAGLVNIQFNYISYTRVQLTSNAPTYTSVGGASSVDDPSNNTNEQNAPRGSWTGGWFLDRQVPAVFGVMWEDTFRTMAGLPALATSGVQMPSPAGSSSNSVCTVIDARYVDMVDAQSGTIAKGIVTPNPGVTYWYYTGTSPLLDPTAGNASYNPNAFSCAGSTGWTNVKPTDMSTVRAVKAIISPAAAANLPGRTIASLYVSTKIKNNVAVGQDIWTWTSFKVGTNGTWINPNRETTAPPVLATGGVLTPKSRYPFTGGGRDVLRIISATPSITKTVDQTDTAPGATLNYTVTARADSASISGATIPSLKVIDVLPAGLQYVVGSASVPPTTISGQTLTWNLTNVAVNTALPITFQVRVSATALPGATFTNTASATIGTVTANASVTTRVRDGGYTMLTKTAAQSKVPQLGGVAQDSWTVRITSKDVKAQTFTDTVDVLPYNGDGRGTNFTGTYALSGAVQAVAGSTVYYSTAAPATLRDDPAHASNGAAGSITGNTVGWSTTYTAAATAVRVIGPALPAGGAQEFVIGVVTAGATYSNVYVNRAEARASRTGLVMRTSSRFEIGAVNSVTIKKYVQDSNGVWHDANDIDDYPQFAKGATLKYRLIVTNTGDEPLNELVLTDDRVNLWELNPLPTGLAAGAVIPVLNPGVANALTFEYSVLLANQATGGVLVNTACVGPQSARAAASAASTDEYVPEPVEMACDPAGIKVLPSSLTWEKIASGTSVRLSGSQWELTPVDANNMPTGPAGLVVVDCVAATPADCAAADKNPAPGVLTVRPVEDGRYRLVETRAPAGYQLDPTPRYINVSGDTQFSAPITNTMAEVPAIPLTGGMGSLNFWLGAGVLGALMAGGLLLQRRRSAA